MIVPLHLTILEQHLKYCVQSYRLYLQMNTNFSAELQKNGTQMVVSRGRKRLHEKAQNFEIFSLGR